MDPTSNAYNEPLAATVEKNEKSNSFDRVDDDRKLKRDGGLEVSLGEAAHDACVHRKLTARQIQLLALAGTVGAALFVDTFISLKFF